MLATNPVMHNPGMHFVVRKVNMKDANARLVVNGMIDQVSKDLDWSYTDRCTRGEWWLAYNEKRPVAFAGLVPMSDYFSVGYLCAAGVLPDFRGHGLQKRLIRRRIARARELGCVAIYTDTIHENAASANSLIACGFRQFVPHTPWGDTQHVHFWSLNLR